LNKYYRATITVYSTILDTWFKLLGRRGRGVLPIVVVIKRPQFIFGNAPVPEARELAGTLPVPFVFRIKF